VWRAAERTYRLRCCGCWRHHLTGCAAGPPLVDDVKVTLDYDLDAPLAAPRWLDGYQQFVDVPYSPAWW